MRDRDTLTILKRTTTPYKSNIISSLIPRNDSQKKLLRNHQKTLITPFKFCIVSIIIFQFVCFVLFEFVDTYNTINYLTHHINHTTNGIPPNIFSTGFNKSIYYADCKYLFNHWNYKHFDIASSDQLIESFFSSSFNDPNSFLSNITTFGIERSDLWRYIVIYKYGGMYLDTDIKCEIPYKDWFNNLHYINRKEINFPYNKDSVHQMPANGFNPNTDIDMMIGMEYWFPVHTNAMQFVQWVFLSKANNPILDHVIKSVMNAVVYIPQNLNNIQRRTGPLIWSSSILDFMSKYALDLSGVKPIPLIGCKYKYDGPKLGYLNGCITAHCIQFRWMDKAQSECNKDVRCVGITETLDGVYEMRYRLPLIESNNERSWIKVINRNTSEYCRRKQHYVVPKVLLKPQSINEYGQLVSLYYNQQRLYLLILPHLSFGYMGGWDGKPWTERLQSRRFMKHFFRGSWWKKPCAKNTTDSECVFIRSGGEESDKFKNWKLNQLEEENRKLKQQIIDSKI